MTPELSRWAAMVMKTLRGRDRGLADKFLSATEAAHEIDDLPKWARDLVAYEQRTSNMNAN